MKRQSPLNENQDEHGATQVLGWTFTGCLAAALITLWFTQREAFLGQAKAFLAIFTATGANLLVLQQAVSAFLKMLKASHEKSEEYGYFFVRVLIFGSLKLVLFGLLAVLIWRYRTNPVMTLLLGISPIVIVPLVGGYLWSRN